MHGVSLRHAADSGMPNQWRTFLSGLERKRAAWPSYPTFGLDIRRDKAAVKDERLLKYIEGCALLRPHY